MFKLRPFLSIAIAGTLFATACSGEQQKPTTEATPVQQASALVKAPDFEVTTIEGKKVSLEATLAEGKPMVVYFTASWCPVCAKNWPVLSEVYPEYKDKLNFVAIGIDPTDDEAVMKKLSAEKGFTFPLTAGNPDIMVDFGVKSQATTVGVNKDGYIAFMKNKTALSADEYRSLFDELLK